MKFRATVELGGKTATGIQVPAQVVEDLGSAKRPRVRVRINGYTYRSTVAPIGGVFMLPVSAEVRERAGVAVGDEVEVEVQLDTEPREVTLPPDFAAALDGDVDAKRFFDGLSYSNKQRLVLAIAGAKTSETRQRRITSTVSTLHAGQT
ncbi:MAG TPA: YdeI/OmpD-associated family protein [Ktedonobacterales bacterium]|nr:YdeI/OmpD-associated family protein [Ktedonobacterales bacterium]